MQYEKLLGCLGVVAVSALITAMPARAAEFTLKYSIPTQGDVQEAYANEFKARLEKASGGRIEVQVYPRGQIGTPAASIEGMQLGTIEAYMAPIDFFLSLDKRAGIFSIPFMFKGRMQANRVIDANPELREEVLALFEPDGIVGCEFFTANDGLYIAKDPIRTVADFNGKKLRVNATPAEIERFKRLGAAAVPMSLPDMVTSLQSGVIDGTMSGISIHVNFNLESTSKVLLETEDTLLVIFGGISKKWLDSLPADLREMTIKECRGLHEFSVAEGNNDNKVLREKWAARGGELYHFPPEEYAKFKDLLATVGEEVTKADPDLSAFYRKWKAAVEKVE